MPPLRKEDSSQPQGYVEIFGSWFKALEEAGVLEGGVIKTKRGCICEAKDGHKCLSLGEKTIDDYLYTHKIPHEKEPHYPGAKQYRADWRVAEYFIEFWGMQGEENYDKKIEAKRTMAKQMGIPLIEITFEDMYSLDLKLKGLLESGKGK